MSTHDQTTEPQGVVDPAEFVAGARKQSKAPAKGGRTSGSGRLSALIDPQIHRAAGIAAQFRGVELRELVAEALAQHPDVARVLDQLKEMEAAAAEAPAGKPKK